MHNPKSILITGASSGIGKALALALAQKGRALALFGRNGERLIDTQKKCEEKGAVAQIFSVDVTNALEMKKAIELFDDNFPLDLIIANAGLGTAQSQEANGGVVNISEMIHTNIFSIHTTLEPLLERLKKRGEAQIAIMSSIASLRAFSKYYIYNASKAYARIYAQGLRLDLQNYQIQVSAIAPGFVDTPLTQKNRFKMPFLMSCEKAAAIILKGLKKNKPLIAFPKITYFLMRLLNSLPECLAEKISKKIT